jgi:hypothetical protein
MFLYVLQRQKLMVVGQNKLTTAIHNKLTKGDYYGNNTGEIGGIIGGFEVVSGCPCVAIRVAHPPDVDADA